MGACILHHLTDFSTLEWYGWRGAGHGQPSSVFGHQHRIKAGEPITGNIQGQRAIGGKHGLGAAAVAAITGFLAHSTLGRQMMVQFCAQHALGQLFLELPNQPRVSQQALGVMASHLGKQLIQKVIGKWTLGFALSRLVGFGVVGHSVLL